MTIAKMVKMAAKLPSSEEDSTPQPPLSMCPLLLSPQYTERIGQVNSLHLKTDCNEVYGLMKIKCFEMFAH